MGVLGLLFGVLVSLTLPDYGDGKAGKKEEEDDKGESKDLTLSRMARSPSIWFPFVVRWNRN